MSFVRRLRLMTLTAGSTTGLFTYMIRSSPGPPSDNLLPFTSSP